MEASLQAPSSQSYLSFHVRIVLQFLFVSANEARAEEKPSSGHMCCFKESTRHMKTEASS